MLTPYFALWIQFVLIKQLKENKMKKEITLPETISARTEFKRKFTFGQMYLSFVYAIGAFSILGKNKKSELIHPRSEEHTSELQSRPHLVCRLLLEKKKKN